jgi:hypothetical protein
MLIFRSFGRLRNDRGGNVPFPFVVANVATSASLCIREQLVNPSCFILP